MARLAPFARLALLLFAFAAPARAQKAPQPERISGTVLSDSGVAVPNAMITVTPAGAGMTASVSARSNTDGKWQLVMPMRADEYYVTVSALGWVQVRVTAKSSGLETGTVVDAKLKRSAVVLSTVRVVEQRRQPPPRDLLVGGDIAATEKGVLASSEVFSIADQGSLTGMISQVPGVTLTTDATSQLPTFSMLGLSGAQNNTTLNGLNFGGSDVPRDIIGLVRVTGLSYDVSRGGFSGAQLSVTQGGIL